MAAVATIEDLQAVEKDLGAMHKKHPDAYDALVELLKKHRMVGYKNICRLAMGSTPEDLKKTKE